MSWGMPTFAERLTGLSGNGFLRAVFAGQNVMIDYDRSDTDLTVCDPDAALPDKVRALAAAGCFRVESVERRSIKKHMNRTLRRKGIRTHQRKQED